MNIRLLLLLLIIQTTCIIPIVVGQFMPSHLQPPITLVSEMETPPLTVRILPPETPPIPLSLQTSLMPTTQAMANQTLSLMSTLSTPRTASEILVAKAKTITPTGQLSIKLDNEKLRSSKKRKVQTSINKHATFASNSYSNFKSSIPHNNEIIETLINKVFNPNSVQDLQPVTNYLKNFSPESQHYYSTNGNQESFLQKLINGQGYGHQPTTSFLGGSIYFMQQNSPQSNHQYQYYLPGSTFSYESYLQPNSYPTFMPAPVSTVNLPYDTFHLPGMFNEKN
uniref:Uncharacterized protein LOC113793334 isoform X1 n=1 Tax=Dermatophagoides pteronyssinus TaxID=6956 RepID=A0A6P6Y423_DERPT|nr:uncharacterized protein LOC113793334 isoform X1 [Dermatophagoides pteronyssinus]